MADNGRQERSDFTKALGARLRNVRTQQKLSLQGVEEKSFGRWKAVVVGSYERGDRSVTVPRLAELAEFYGVPIADMLPDGDTRAIRTAASLPVVLNLEALEALGGPNAVLDQLRRHVHSIAVQRGDYNGKIMTIRASDVSILATVANMDVPQYRAFLEQWSILIERKR